MIAISDQELLAAWDAARSVHPVLRPAMLLRTLAGDAEAEQLPIGQRDRRLLTFRERWRGRDFEGVASCPSCGAGVELTFETPPVTEPAGTLVVLAGDLALEYRLPDSRDLAAVAGSASLDEARMRLAGRCVVRALRGGEEIAVPPLDDETIARIAEAMAAADPDGDLRLALVCRDCNHEWEMLFDPATYLWSELEAAAIGAMREVDALASAYGWSEQAILAIPPARRRIYLGMVLS
jgi:hypothetical protein